MGTRVLATQTVKKEIASITKAHTHGSPKIKTKGFDSYSNSDIIIKLHRHPSTMVIHIRFKFYEFTFTGYLVIIEDRKKDGRYLYLF